MVEVSRKVELLWKYHPSVFEKINMEVLGEPFRKIGSGVSAVAKITTGINAEMLRMVMPEIVKSNPDSRDQNWDKLVSNYWDSLSVMIETNGKVLETGFVFNMTDVNRKNYIKELSFKTDKELADYVMGFKGDKPNVPEEERFRYGHPINPEHYLLWRYCLNYSRVANSVNDINKSPKIAFYLHTQEDRERYISAQRKAKKEAIDLYIKFVTNASMDDYNDVLSLLTPDSIREIVNSKDMEDKQAKIMEFATSEPVKFAEIVTDKNRQLKAVVERFISYGVLKQLPESTVVVESADPSVIIGNNINECVSFFANEKNGIKYKELIAKYKSIIQ
jgi:hypothetical protein